MPMFPQWPAGHAQRDRPRPGAEQAAAWPAGGVRRGRPRIRTLVRLRAVAIAGQAMTILFVAFVLNFDLPLAPCLALVGLSVVFNIWISVSTPSQRLADDWEACAHIAFDTVLLTALLYLTGGVANPFSLLLIAPATLGAATLPGRHALALALLAIAAAIGIAIRAYPLPGGPDDLLVLPVIDRMGRVAALVLGIVFTTLYAWQASAEAARMELALDVTQSVLAREQRVSALGALAAAAAHELGTPLATIAIVARELSHSATTSGQREDAELLISQAARCRDILQRLTEEPESGDLVHGRVGLAQLLKEAVEPFTYDEVLVETVVLGEGYAPEIWRLPELPHALMALVENAVGFAAASVVVTAKFDDDIVEIQVRDDGPGFTAEILSKLGEPYVTSRPGVDPERAGGGGMGLGFFIAKTLLERTGGHIAFRNGRLGGAVVEAHWVRSTIEAGDQQNMLRHRLP